MDEESVQHRASNLMAGPLFLRCFAMPESSHPQWNDCNRALQSSGLKSAVLRGTVLANHFRGPFRSGRYQYELEEAAYAYLRHVSDEDLASFSEEFAFDVGDREAVLTKAAFLGCPGVKTRLPSAALVSIGTQVYNYIVLLYYGNIYIVFGWSVFSGILPGLSFVDLDNPPKETLFLRVFE